ncbi:ABC transporter permease [Thermoleptolyngbya sp.]
MLELFLAELRRSWIQLLRYSTEAIAGIVITTVVFYGLFLSARYIAGPDLQFGDRLDAVIIGYVLWTLALFIMSDVAGNLQREAQTGTLEQLFLSPYSPPQLFLTRALASLTIQLTLIACILGVISLLTGTRLSFPPAVLPAFVTVLLGAYGLAFAMGSLSLLLKQVQQLLGIFQFALLFLLAVPSETWSGPLRLLGLLLPMAPGAGLLRDVMARGVPLHVSNFGLALLNGVIYFALGLTLFHLAERETKRRGKLAGY